MHTLVKYLFMICVCLLCVGTTLTLRGADIHAQDILDFLFAEPKRFNQPRGYYAAGEQEAIRGRAQQVQPDIDLPPAPNPQAQSQNPQPLPDNPRNYEHFKGEDFKQLISGLENVAEVARAKLCPNNNLREALPSQVRRPANSAQKIHWIAPPPGFMTADTFNYLIYREEQPVTAAIKSVLDTIHGNLMLDLTPFTLIIKPNKILVMLFNAHKSYMAFTQRPAWSGASSDLQSDTMYIIEQTGYYPLAVHELTHLYFDGYFLPVLSPLWLSEGMAVYMQIHATKQTPDWVSRNLDAIVQTGQVIPFDEMTTVTDLQQYSDDQASLWYTQAYSVVDYLLNAHTRDEFYRFCNELKAETPLYQALYRAYGMPFNKVSVLQNVWLHDLQKKYRQAALAAQPAVYVPAAPPVQQPAATPAPKAQTAAAPAAYDRPAAAAVPAPVRRPPQQTKINKLKMVPTNGYKGGF